MNGRPLSGFKFRRMVETCSFFRGGLPNERDRVSFTRCQIDPSV
jgi:hypothetical protein